MQHIKIMLTSLLTFVSVNIAAQTIQIYCPTQINFTAESQSWASYQYTAYTRVDLPPVGDQIELTGEGNVVPPKTPADNPILKSANWSDKTFLCNYEGKTATGATETMVLYETVLADYVSSCYFTGGNSGCHITDNNPLDCPLTCELSESKHS